MNKRTGLLLVITLALMGATAGLLGQFHAHQKLAPPGVKTQPLPNSIRLRVDLPERVLDFESKWEDTDKETLATLPQDTSFGQRRYTAPDDFVALLNVVLMGTDRTSLHKPQFCLEGLGWQIDQAASTESRVRIEKPCRYDLPVVELVASKVFETQGRKQLVRGIYVYWYVADDALSAGTSGFERMRWMAGRLLRTGVLQRWAYVSCFSICAPGQEKVTFERMKEFIAAAVPEFQLTPPPAQVAVISQQ